MKKVSLFMLILMLTVSLAACGRKDTPPETETTTTPTTEPITVPTLPDMTMPSENIPDPTVDSNSGNQETEATTK